MDKSILQMNNLMCNMTKKEDRNKVSQRVSKTQKLKQNHNGYPQHNPENSERNLETDMNG